MKDKADNIYVQQETSEEDELPQNQAYNDEEEQQSISVSDNLVSHINVND